MSKKNRVAIYEQLFNEGVLVALKDTHAPKHPELPDIPNLQVRRTWALCLKILLRAVQSRELTDVIKMERIFWNVKTLQWLLRKFSVKSLKIHSYDYMG